MTSRQKWDDYMLRAKRCTWRPDMSYSCGRLPQDSALGSPPRAAAGHTAPFLAGTVSLTFEVPQGERDTLTSPRPWRGGLSHSSLKLGTHGQVGNKAKLPGSSLSEIPCKAAHGGQRGPQLGPLGRSPGGEPQTRPQLLELVCRGRGQGGNSSQRGALAHLWGWKPGCLCANSQALSSVKRAPGLASCGRSRGKHPCEAGCAHCGSPVPGREQG